MSSLLTRGYQSTINSTQIEDGKIRFAVDSGRLFIDSEHNRIEITDFVKGLNYREILALSDPLPKMYLSADTHQFMIYDTAENKWISYSGADFVAKSLADKNGNDIDKTYISNIDFDQNGNIIIIKGDGTVETISSTEGVTPVQLINQLTARVEELERIVNILTSHIEIAQNE